MKKTIILFLALIVATVLTGFLVWNEVNTRQYAVEYDVVAKYKSMPDKDKELQDWLEVQPGVSNAVVVQDSRGLSISFVMLQNLLGTDPPMPDLQRALADLGYQGQVQFTWKSQFYVK